MLILIFFQFLWLYQNIIKILYIHKLKLMKSMNNIRLINTTIHLNYYFHLKGLFLFYKREYLYAFNSNKEQHVGNNSYIYIYKWHILQ